MEYLKETPKYSGNYLKETPNYDNLPNLNETPDLSLFKIQENLNDGWDQNLNIEVRVNGQLTNPANPYQQQRRRKSADDPNGLNQYLDQDLNEVYRPPVINNQPTSTTNFDVAVVSYELFERVNHQALGTLADVWKNKIK